MSGQNVSLFIGICFPFIKLGHGSALYLKNRRKEIKSQYNWSGNRKRGEKMERVHFDENENRRDCIGGKIKKEDHEMDKIRNNCHQSIIISLVAIVISVAVLVTNVIFG